LSDIPCFVPWERSLKLIEQRVPLRPSQCLIPRLNPTLILWRALIRMKRLRRVVSLYWEALRKVSMGNPNALFESEVIHGFTSSGRSKYTIPIPGVTHSDTLEPETCSLNFRAQHGQHFSWMRFRQHGVGGTICRMRRDLLRIFQCAR